MSAAITWLVFGEVPIGAVVASSRDVALRLASARYDRVQVLRVQSAADFALQVEEDLIRKGQRHLVAPPRVPGTAGGNSA